MNKRKHPEAITWRKPLPFSGEGRLWSAVQAFRNLGANMLPLYTIQAFIGIALNEGISISELAKLIHVNQASATRIAAFLAEESDRHEAEQGRRDTTLNYVELYVDERDRRRTLCRLTPRGRGFYETLLALLGGNLQEENDGT